MRALLTQLPDSQQEVIALAFYGELTHTEIATALGLPAGTIKGRMRLGLQKLLVQVSRRKSPREQERHRASRCHDTRTF